jgi:membrane protein DedA with SNARE-associated domain
MLVASLTSSLTKAIGDYGVYAVFGLMAIDAVFPAASEVVMVYAGALAGGAFAGQHVSLFGASIAHGFPAYLVVSLAGTLGYLVGSLGGWAIGDYGGRPLLERRGKLFHLDAGKLDRAERWFERWGDWAVLLGRITPVVRSFISIPAGVFRAPLGRYTVLTTIGSALWCFAIAGAGWALGSSWERFHKGFRFADYVVVLAVVVGAAWLVRSIAAGRKKRRAAYTDSAK